MRSALCIKRVPMKYLYWILIFLLPFTWVCDAEQAKPEQAKPAAKVYSPPKPNPVYPLSDTAYLLVFLEEDSMEIWAETTADVKQFLQAIPVLAEDDTPVGAFSLPQTFEPEGYVIEFPNEFYKSKNTWFIPQDDIYLTTQPIADGFAIQLTDTDWLSLVARLARFREIQVLIFPNDARKNGNLTPCLQCPLWMAEVYSSLYAHLQAFTDKPVLAVSKQPTNINL